MVRLSRREPWVGNLMAAAVLAVAGCNSSRPTPPGGTEDFLLAQAAWLPDQGILRAHVQSLSAEIASYLGTPPIRVEVEFDEAAYVPLGTGTGDELGVLGRTRFSDPPRVRIASLCLFDLSLFQNVATHELVHVHLHHHPAARLPAVVEEGLCQVVADTLHPYRGVVHERRFETAPPRPELLVLGHEELRELPKADMLRSYGAGLELARRLVARHGFDGLMRLVREGGLTREVLLQEMD